MVRGTLIVLVLLGFSLWGLRWWMRRQTPGEARHGGLAVVGTLFIGPRCQLRLVEADGHRVLLSVDSGSVKCMSVLPQRFPAALAMAENGTAELDQDVAQHLPVSLTYDRGLQPVA